MAQSNRYHVIYRRDVCEVEMCEHAPSKSVALEMLDVLKRAGYYEPRIEPCRGTCR